MYKRLYFTLSSSSFQFSITAEDIHRRNTQVFWQIWYPIVELSTMIKTTHLCDVVIPQEERSNSSSYKDVNLIHLDVTRAPRDAEACRSPWSAWYGQLSGWRSSCCPLTDTSMSKYIYNMRQTDLWVMMEQVFLKVTYWLNNTVSLCHMVQVMVMMRCKRSP